MAKDFWCNLKFHLPGEKARHTHAKKKAEAIVNSVKKKDKNEQS